MNQEDTTDASKKDDGSILIPDDGYAFPGKRFARHGELRDEMGYMAYPGMTLRDWFAGMALAGMCTNINEIVWLPNVSLRAYELADSMLAERKKK